MSTANDILMSGGGTFVGFKTIGDTVTGSVVNIGEPYQAREFNNATNKCDGPLKVTKAGKPVMAFHITLSTSQRDPSNGEDDGTRVIDVNSWRMRDAIRNAVRAVAAPGLEVGAQLTVTYTHDETAGDPRSGKNYSASYSRAANSALMGEQPPAAAQAAPAVTQAAPAATAAAQNVMAGMSPDQLAEFQRWSASQQAPQG